MNEDIQDQMEVASMVDKMRKIKLRLFEPIKIGDAQTP